MFLYFLHNMLLSNKRILNKNQKCLIPESTTTCILTLWHAVQILTQHLRLPLISLKCQIPLNFLWLVSTTLFLWGICYAEGSGEPLIKLHHKIGLNLENIPPVLRGMVDLSNRGMTVWVWAWPGQHYIKCLQSKRHCWDYFNTVCVWKYACRDFSANTLNTYSWRIYSDYEY